MLCAGRPPRNTRELGGRHTLFTGSGIPRRMAPQLGRSFYGCVSLRAKASDRARACRGISGERSRGHAAHQVLVLTARHVRSRGARTFSCAALQRGGIGNSWIMDGDVRVSRATSRMAANSRRTQTVRQNGICISITHAAKTVFGPGASDTARAHSGRATKEFPSTWPPSTTVAIDRRTHSRGLWRRCSAANRD